MDYKVSVIVPVYKAEHYLKQCVDSLLTQTLKGIEIILLDDGSPDNSGKICDEYANQHSNIVVKHLENGGPSKARNIGLELAKGQYIGFVDSDDYVSPQMYERLYNEAISCCADITMCTYSLFDGTSMRPIKMEYTADYCNRDEIVLGLLARYSTRDHNGLYSVWNKLFNNNLLQHHQIKFNEELIRAEDAWFVFECLKVACKVRFINESLYTYRQVAGSTMHTVQSDRYERSKNFRKKLRGESEQLDIKIDNDEFNYEFLYEAIMYCRSMMQAKDYRAVKAVLGDKFFKEACKFKKRLPKHLRLICQLETMNWQGMIMLLLWGWSK